jgi:hypothetical protein
MTVLAGLPGIRLRSAPRSLALPAMLPPARSAASNTPEDPS